MRWGAFLICAVLGGQPISLHVYSEFARIDASGEVTAPAQPREILSPAIVRNGFTSFQVVVQAPKGTSYTLYIGQNPERAVQVTMYRESGDRLQKVELPYQGSSTEIFWMDLWADRAAAVRRIKVEPELSASGEWVIYPMEVRVVEAVVPDAATTATSIRAMACGTPAAASGSSERARMHVRNAQQDVALGTRVPREQLRRIAMCDAGEGPDPEWYLRIRDSLFRLP